MTAFLSLLFYNLINIVNYLFKFIYKVYTILVWYFTHVRKIIQNGIRHVP